MSLPQPRAVIFDFGGVLCFHPAKERFAAIAEMLGVPTLRLLEIFWARRLEYDGGQLDARAYWTYVAGAAGKTLSESELPALTRLEVELWTNYDRRILDWVAELQKQGVRTAVLSNLPRSIGENLRATPGFLDPFDHVTFSFELGVVKPQPEIYHDALRGVGVEPGQALFLDDKPENVEGAQAVGLLGEIYSTWEDFLATALPRYDLPAPR
jgi:putative hydrolase of the HAD superfamily